METPDGRTVLALDSASELFHEASSLQPSDLTVARTVWSVNNAPAIREVISRPASPYSKSPGLSLAPTDLTAAGGLLAAMGSRRSGRAFGTTALSPAQLSILMQCACGVTERVTDDTGNTWGFRAAPSGGALFPVEAYVVVLHVDAIEPGLYAYDPEAHALRHVRGGSFAADLGDATYMRPECEAAGMCLLLAASFPRTKFKYGERGYRFALLEAGHIVQNLLLAAEAIGLAGVPVGGFVDARVNSMLSLDGREHAAIYLALVGSR